MPESSTMLTTDTPLTVNEVLMKHPDTVSGFNQLGIDACCGGDASLGEAARRDGANAEALIAALNAIITREDR